MKVFFSLTLTYHFPLFHYCHSLVYAYCELFLVFGLGVCVCEGVCPATQNNKTGQNVLAAGHKSEDTQMSTNTFNEVPFYLIAKKFL